MDDEKMTRRAEEARLNRQLRAELTEEQWIMHDRLVELATDVWHEDESRIVRELARHLPGQAPAIRAMEDHLLEQRPDQVGSCCESPAEGRPS